MSDTALERMEALLDERGFAETSVDDLRDAARISLRTLYRRYGSRDGLVLAAIRSRADRYLNHLAGAEGVRQLFDRVGAWCGQGEPHGCLLLRARADHPDDVAVRRAVADYHDRLRALIAEAVEADGLHPDVVDEIFVLHEGLLAAAPVVGSPAALGIVQTTLDRLLPPS